MRLIPVLVALLAASPAWSAPMARAQEGCAPHHEVAEFLSSDHAELPIASGIANNGGLVEVFSTDERDTWTLLITLPNGWTCMMAAGTSWVELRDDPMMPQPPSLVPPPEPGT